MDHEGIIFNEILNNSKNVIFCIKDPVFVDYIKNNLFTNVNRLLCLTLSKILKG